MIYITSHKYYLLLLCLIFIIICNGFALGQNIDFFGCEGVPWVADSSVTHDGDISLRSGPIECSGSSILCGRVKGPVDISFWWKNGGYSKIGQLMFEINGSKVFECDSRDWKKFSYPLNDGDVHTLKWTFRRISSYPKWEGSAWLAGINSSGISPISSGGYSASNIGSLSESPSINEKNLQNVPNDIILENGPIIQLIRPKNWSWLAFDRPVEFEIKVENHEKVPLCELIIDGSIINDSRHIYDDESTIFTNMLNETGMHNWTAQCYDCQGRYNSSKVSFFYLNAVNKTTYVRSGQDGNYSEFTYSEINDAINHTTVNGTVLVYGGNYNHNIYINKSLNLTGLDEPVLDLKNKSSSGIIIKSSGVKVNGFVIKNTDYGIKAETVHNIIISNNNISSCSNGVKLTKCSNISILNNSIYDCKQRDTQITPNAIYIENCETCSISGNIINKYKSISINITNCIILNGNKYVTICDNEFLNYGNCAIKSDNDDCAILQNCTKNCVRINYFDKEDKKYCKGENECKF